MKYGELPPKKARNFSAKAQYEIRKAKNIWGYIFLVIKLIPNVCAGQVSFVSVWFPIIITVLSGVLLVFLAYLDSYIVDRNVYLYNIKQRNKPPIYAKMSDTPGASSAVTGCVSLFVLLIICIFCVISGKKFSTAEALDMLSYFFMALYFDVYWERSICFKCFKRNLITIITLIKENPRKLQSCLFCTVILLCIAYQIYTIVSVIQNYIRIGSILI